MLGDIADFLRRKLTPRQKAALWPIYLALRWLAWPLLNPIFKRRYASRRGLLYHVGCDGYRISGFVNVDLRITPGVDLTYDLAAGSFPGRDVAGVFGNAFFEHLFRDRRIPHLRAVLESLDPEQGFVCYTGLPYFPSLARFYLNHAPGAVSPLFELYNVYRFTHGDPEHRPSWYLAQLHKSLFDEAEVSGLLNAAGFGSYVGFVHTFPGDVNQVPAYMGFYAVRGTVPSEALRERCRAFLRRFDGEYVRVSALEFCEMPSDAPPPLDFRSVRRFRSRTPTPPSVSS